MTIRAAPFQAGAAGADTKAGATTGKPLYGRWGDADVDSPSNAPSPQRGRLMTKKSRSDSDTSRAGCIAFDELRYQQAADRIWLMMALIGVVISDHVVIARNTAYRHQADKARKALLDLYQSLERGISRKPSRLTKMAATHSEPEDDFGREFLRLKGSIPRSVDLEPYDSGGPKRSRLLKHRGKKPWLYADHFEK
jgi:hypothetical protein